MYSYLSMYFFLYLRVVSRTQVRAHMSLHPYYVLHTYFVLYILYLLIQKLLFKDTIQRLLCTSSSATVHLYKNPEEDLDSSGFSFWFSVSLSSSPPSL